MRFHQIESVFQSCIGTNHQWIDDHAALEFLHLTDFFGLTLWCHVLVDDTEATSLRHSNRQARFCHCVHCGREDRQMQMKIARDSRVQFDLRWHDLRMPWKEQNIIKSQRFVT